MSRPYQVILGERLTVGDADVFTLRHERATYVVVLGVDSQHYVDPSGHVYELVAGTPFHDALLQACELASALDELEPADADPPVEDDLTGRCGVCGERYDQRDPRPSVSDVGEFYDPSRRFYDPTSSDPYSNHVIAHAECGLHAGLQPA